MEGQLNFGSIATRDWCISRAARYPRPGTIGYRRPANASFAITSATVPVTIAAAVRIGL